MIRSKPRVCSVQIFLLHILLCLIVICICMGDSLVHWWTVEKSVLRWTSCRVRRKYQRAGWRYDISSSTVSYYYFLLDRLCHPGTLSTSS